MERYYLQSGCDLNRGDRHDDMDFRALAGAFTDAAPLGIGQEEGTGEYDTARKALLRRLKSYCLEVNSSRLSLASQGHDCMIILR